MSKTEKCALVPKLRFGEFEGEWRFRTLQTLQAIDYDITYGVLKPGDYEPEGIPLLQIKDINKGIIDTSAVHLITQELHDQYKRTILKENDIVVSVVGSIGHLALIPKKTRRCERP